MKSFKRGIHPPGNKELAADKAIVAMPLVEIYKVPTQQHIGAPAKPIVAVGDVVKKGQPITEPQGFVSAPSHAPTSGTVKEIGTTISPVTGLPVAAIVIEADGQDEWYEGLPLNRDPLSMDTAELLECIKAAGIVGMGGATFPTHVKLSPPKDKQIDQFIVNGAECEPYLTADYRLMLEEADRIIGGTQIVMKILGLKEAVIAVEDNKPEAVKVLRAKAPQGIKVEYVKVKYPQGAERQLIYAICGREVPSGGLPMDAGAVVQNAGTVAAIWDACVSGQPLIERVTTVTGRGVAEPKNLKVRVGTPLEKVVEFCGGLKDAGKIVSGGPMMGFALGSLDTVITKGTSGLTILSKEEVNKSAMTACIGCGRCVTACPCGLVPSTFSKLGELNLYERALDKENLMDCFECGSCTFVCPAHRPIVQYIKHMKALGREASAKKKEA